MALREVAAETLPMAHDPWLRLTIKVIMVFDGQKPLRHGGRGCGAEDRLARQCIPWLVALLGFCPGKGSGEEDRASLSSAPHPLPPCRNGF